MDKEGGRNFIDKSLKENILDVKTIDDRKTLIKLVLGEELLNVIVHMHLTRII